MDRGLFIASSSASNLMDKLSIINQNLSNVSTVGFKRILDQQLSVPVHGDGGVLDGGRTYAVTSTPSIDKKAGATLTTGDMLNFSLNNDLYVATSVSGAYTRRGDVMTDAEGVLRLPSGQALVSTDGGEIAIPVGYVGAISNDGTVWAQDPGNAANKQEIAKLGIYSSGQVSLRPDGFLALKEPTPAEDGQRVLVSGTLEQSNVSSADMMVSMIETSRLYDLQTKMMSTFNTMDQKGSEIISNWQ